MISMAASRFWNQEKTASEKTIHISVMNCRVDISQKLPISTGSSLKRWPVMKDFSEFTLILYPERPWNMSQMVNITDGAKFEGTPLIKSSFCMWTFEESLATAAISHSQSRLPEACFWIPLLEHPPVLTSTRANWAKCHVFRSHPYTYNQPGWWTVSDWSE